MNSRLSEAVAVDTHCHLDLYSDAGAVLSDAETNRVLVVAVTNAPSVFFHTRDLAKRCEWLVPAVGLHPELVATHGHEVSRIGPLLEQTQFVRGELVGVLAAKEGPQMVGYACMVFARSARRASA